MSRITTVGLCALALTIFGGVTRGEKLPDAPLEHAAPQATQPIDVASANEVKSRAKISQALDEPTHFEMHGMPLQDVVAYLKDFHKVEIQIDVKALEEASIGTDTPVTRTLESVTLRSGLRLLLGSLDLTYVIKDEVLLITTPDKAESEMVIKIYPVADLTAPRNAALGGEDFKPLIQAIRSTIAVTTWDDVGGPGSIVPLAQARSLIVSQTGEVHEQIFQLLTGLRQARDAQPAALNVTLLGSLADAATARRARDPQPASGEADAPAAAEASPESR